MLDHTAREPAPPIARRAALRSHGALGAGLGRLCVPDEPFASRRHGAVAVGDQEVGRGNIGAPTPREADPGWHPSSRGPLPPCLCAQARERRRVERALELESRVLSRIEHPHIVGFRAAQRLPDGRLGLVLEACECSLYGLLQDRHFELGCPPRPFLAAADVLSVATGIALALVHLHDEMGLLHGDIKSANVLVARDLSLVKASPHPLNPTPSPQPQPLHPNPMSSAH